MRLSGEPRGNFSFEVPEQGETNYFDLIAKQHKQAHETALDSYFDSLESIEQLIAYDSSDSNTKANKEATLREKANQYKAKSDQEESLFMLNELLSQGEKNKKSYKKNSDNNNIMQADNKATRAHHEIAQDDNKEMEADKKPAIAHKEHAKGNRKPSVGIDTESKAAVDEFTSIIGSKQLTADEMSELYLRYSRQISINSPDAWSELDSAYSNALGNAYTPDNTMDSQSRNAITNFSSTINSSMTKDQMMETYIRFSREISVNYPQAWQELESILNNSLPNAYKVDNTMDDQSRNAISNFRSAINSGMTADEMNETFLRFSREVSIKYPEAWKELEGTLANYLPQAFVADTTMDNQSRNAITNFKTSISDNMTEDEMVEMFLRFTREVSINFPQAFNELESILGQNIPNAFKENTTTDAESEQAVSDFKNSIKKENTKDDLIEMFLRYSRNISIKYPEKKNELLAALNQSLPNAFKPDTTIDNDSKKLVKDFETIITTKELGKDDFNNLFQDYFKQIGLNLTKARKMMNDMRTTKVGDSIKKTESTSLEDQQKDVLKSSFAKLVEKTDTLNYKVQQNSRELAGIYNLDDQNNKKAEIDKLMESKNGNDDAYFSLMSSINGNEQASFEIKDDYLFSMSVEKVSPDKKERLDRDTQKVTEYDMLRTMRRDELKGMVNEIPQEALTDILYNVPKYHLINGLTLLPHEEQIEALTTNRFEDALLREMPRKDLIEQLPDAYEMLPVLMMTGKSETGFRMGTDLIEDTITKNYHAEAKPNETRAQEELLPFMMEELLNKSPRMADANRPSLGVDKPIEAQIKNFENPGSINGSSNNNQRLTRVEDLSNKQLSELAQEALNKCDPNDTTTAMASKRGNARNFMQFLEDMKKVDSVDAGKMAMTNLYNNQAQTLKDEVLPRLSQNEILKINKFYGRDPKEMVKQMPSHVVHKQIHELNKIQVVESYKKVGKEMIMNRIQTLPSQTLARATADMVDRDTVQKHFYNNEGLAS